MEVLDRLFPFLVSMPHFVNSISMTWIAKYNKYSTSTTILILIF